MTMADEFLEPLMSNLSSLFQMQCVPIEAFEKPASFEVRLVAPPPHFLD
jgi:hypothetical protein